MSARTVASRTFRIALLAGVLVIVAGCAPTAPEDIAPSDDQATEQTETDTGGTDTAGGCPTPKEADLQPFSSALVTEPIPEGATYGDGSEISFTTSLGEGLYPSYQLLHFVGDVLTANTGGNWDDAGGGKYTNNLLVFDSELDGQPGYIEVTAIPDGVTFDGERYEGDSVVLGIYCITYAVE